MTELHRDPWMMQRITTALDAIRHADREGLEAELDLLAFAEDVLERQREQIVKDIEFERDYPSRGWNDHGSDISEWSKGLFTGIKEGLSAATTTVRQGPMRTHTRTSREA